MASIFNALGNSMNTNQMNPMNRPMNNASNFLEQFKQFKQTFQGDPSEVIKQKLQSGEFTQNQLMQAQGMLKQAYEMQDLFRTNPNPNVRR